MGSSLVDFVLNLPDHLLEVVRKFGLWAYILMGAVVFAETGLIFFGMLPGDSLIFTAGALAARREYLDIRWLLPAMMAASFCGDQANYWLGRLPRLRHNRLLKKRNLERARKLFDTHGGQAIIFGRFIPVIRSVLPLSAAIAGMPYHRFLPFSLAGTALWTLVFTLAGYFFGNLPAVKENFWLVLLAVMLISLVPGAVEFLVEHRRGGRPAHRGRSRRRRTA